VLEVRRTIKGPQIALSRTHPGYLARLFETEIPEIQEAIVIVKATAREAGERAKVAVASTKRDVDPIGACVGLRGTRIQVISRELRGEKIDIIEWSHDPSTFVARALSPAKVSSVTIREQEEDEEQPSALVIVPDNQLSLAIGKKGQNARLAAKLTGMRIDIKSEGELEAERAQIEAAEQGRQALATLPGVDAVVLAALQGAGLASPAAVADAGVEKLRAIEAVGERAEALHRGAAEWVAAHAPAPEPETETAVEESAGTDSEGDAGGAEDAPAAQAPDARNASASE
jgi:N utilization substance protein A